MYLIINKATKKVFAIEENLSSADAYSQEVYVTKEWFGKAPRLPSPFEGFEGDDDPTLADPTYQDIIKEGQECNQQIARLVAELAWLSETLPTIETMTPAQMRTLTKRLAQQNEATLKIVKHMARERR